MEARIRKADGTALRSVLSLLEKKKQITVLSVPGSKNFYEVF